MKMKKEFYFVRHGQTDHNLLEARDKHDHPKDISLNQTGRNQAKKIEPLIASLPIRTVCCSPMKRAQETKEIITAQLNASHFDVEHLGECSAEIWKEMSQLGMYSPIPSSGKARLFLDRVQKGLDHALSLQAPVLIVAHGGVHWAINCLLQTENHSWSIENCGVVHFVTEGKKWIARKL